MIKFVGAGPGDAELITVKGMKALQEAEVVLYTGSLVPRELLDWCQEGTIIENSADMSYEDIFSFIKKYADKNFVRLHTGDSSIYSTIAKQIEFLKNEKLDFEVIPGVTAAFGAAASAGIEYTIPGVSQTLIISRVEGRTPNPESLEQLLLNKHSSFAFYLSITLIQKLKETALKLGYAKETPCWVVEKATWADEKIYRGNIATIQEQVLHVKGVALIMFGEFLHQKPSQESHLYAKKYKQESQRRSKSL
ncbi:precorrin-4 C(11)-methyltransferase [Sulfurimonas sediminis]|uniref:Precorrin-4 C(11)-methyltransferase n=1 Tax=Sulfurimonas sediminis TaxID=2590020 RepID=A0A7M1AYJ4_9BACT|nr:cobalt-precorrin-4/precorrin-4 C(11)-methyltransferase [Sulfurimonas sediminis]QOP42557.1 precorrin-4 C(11)-methyltransferase [Sulfurimonas sediminis]